LSQIFIISDIFGRTPALEQLAQDLAPPGFAVELLDPYKGVDQGFSSQEQAYDAFMAGIGLDDYQKFIKKKLNSYNGTIFLIAFSVGASAVFRLSGNPAFNHVRKAICFYPSQIRHFPDIDPCFDLELIFPNCEPGFDVDKMMAMQKRKETVSCQKAPGSHGFMNKLSPGFHERLYEQFCDAFIKGINS